MAPPDTATRPAREVAQMRSFRVKPSRWEAAKAIAESRDENLSDVLNAALERYVKRNTPKDD